MVRDNDGELHAFRNVCRHRGSRLLSGSGECGKAIRCRYHGWTYRFDGQLIGVPEGRQIPGLDKSQLGLFPARVEVFWGLVFVNLDMDATPLAELAGDLPERFARFGLERLKPRAEKPSSQPANWKIVVDNYLEGYHVPIAHPGLMRLLDYKNYDVELHENWALFEPPLRDKPSGNLMERAYQRMVEPMPGLTEADRRVWRYIFIYPNTTIDLYPDQVGIWRIRPEGPPGHRGPRAHAAAARGGPAQPRRAVRQPQGQRAGERRGRGPGGQPAGRARDARLRARATVEPGGRTGMVRGEDPGGSRLARERILAAAVERIAGDGID